jgi:hypothetical protein
VETQITKEQCEEVLGPIDDDLWEWVVENGRQVEIMRSPAYERGELRGFGTPTYFRSIGIK